MSKRKERNRKRDRKLLVDKYNEMRDKHGKDSMIAKYHGKKLSDFDNNRGA